MKRLTQISFNSAASKTLFVANIVLILLLASSLYIDKMRLFVWFSDMPVLLISMMTILYSCWERGKIIFPECDSKPTISLGISIIGTLLSFGFGAFYHGFWRRLLYPACRDMSYAREAFEGELYSCISSSLEETILSSMISLAIVISIVVAVLLIVKAIIITINKNQDLYERRRFYLLCIELFVFAVFYFYVSKCDFISCY